MGSGFQDVGVKTKGERSVDAEVRKCGEQPAEKDATKASDKITATAIKGMIVESGHTCDLSGAVLIPQTATLDHSTPLSRGGEHVLSNVNAFFCHFKRCINFRGSVRPYLGVSMETTAVLVLRGRMLSMTISKTGSS